MERGLLQYTRGCRQIETSGGWVRRNFKVRFKSFLQSDKADKYLGIVSRRCALSLR